ncbi:MAG: hypothetical protein H7317_06400 [Pseudorhodobacter sp.]|nr:hypothetical protein [Pseudorhodobacter sp.]
MYFMTPKQAVRLMTESTLMMMEAQRVIAMRLGGMSGTWKVGADEDSRMVTEKHQAAVASGQAMMLAAAKGGSVATVALAGLKPVRARTRANNSRLTKSGPKVG